MNRTGTMDETTPKGRLEEIKTLWRGYTITDSQVTWLIEQLEAAWQAANYWEAAHMEAVGEWIKKFEAEREKVEKLREWILHRDYCRPLSLGGCRCGYDKVMGLTETEQKP